MITSWRPIPSPDSVKPASWRISLRAHVCACGKEPASDLINAILDTGSPWSVVTEDIALGHCAIKDIETGPRTSVSWLGSQMRAWQHRVRFVIPHSDSPKVATVLDDFPVLFVHSYIRPGSGSPLSFAVLGTDLCRHILSILDGPEAKIIM